MFSCFIDFPGGFDDGNLFKPFASNSWDVIMKFNFVFVYYKCKMFFLNILELTLEIIHLS